LTILSDSSYSFLPYSFVFSKDSFEYAPLTIESAATNLPETSSTAPEISPTVALNLAASIARASKLPFPVLAASVILLKAAVTALLSLVARIFSSLATCCARTSALFIFRTSKFYSSSASRYLLTPT
jgi:hypothetical protein